MRKEQVEAGSEDQMEKPDTGSASDSDTESASMAAMMGFSSFGAKPNPFSKKRKLNELATSKSGAESGSAANLMPLGKARLPTGNHGVEDSRIKEQKAEPREDGKGVLNTDTGGNLGRGEVVRREGVEQKSNLGSPHGTAAEAGSQQDAYNRHAPRKVMSNGLIDAAYYDASFVEDPWKHLGHSVG